MFSYVPFRIVHLGRSYKNICVSDIFDRKSNNAGERISFTDCVIYGGGQGAHVFISVPDLISTLLMLVSTIVSVTIFI